MNAKHGFLVGIFISVILISTVSAEETVRWDVVQKIMEEAFENSQVMENASWLADVFGPRNMNTPSYRAAAEWARKRLVEYGLSNARLEPYDSHRRKTGSRA